MAHTEALAKSEIPQPTQASSPSPTEAQAWNFDTATVLRLREIAERNRIRQEAGLPLLSVANADSDELARAFRDDVARCSDMMSPGVRCLAGGYFFAFGGDRAGIATKRDGRHILTVVDVKSF
jgi:hypothetical protein